jgi:hypothetical protein
MSGLLPSGAFAGIIFDQSIDLTVNSFASDFDLPNRAADDFELQAGASTITDIRWWGTYAFDDSPTVPDKFTIRIFVDENGSPAINPVFETFVGDVGRGDTGVIHPVSMCMPSQLISRRSICWPTPRIGCQL